MAVGGYDSFNQMLAYQWDGSSWTLLPITLPPGDISDYLADVSCTSATSCMAVGYAVNSIGTQRPLVESWDGTGWSAVASAAPANAVGAELTSVSCPSMGACVAVGSYFANDNSGGHALAESWNGVSWTVLAVPDPVGGAGLTSPALTSVSCSSASACTAVGEYVNGAQFSTLAERWNGMTWTVQDAAEGASGGGTLEGVACTGPTTCIAVGEAGVAPGGTASASTATLTEEWDGASWTTQSSSNVNGSPGNFLEGVSCPSATACSAVGGGANLTLAAELSGSSWTSQSTPDTTTTPAYLNAVSCATSAACMAVGYFVDGLGDKVPLSETFDGTSWTIQTAPAPDGTTASQLLGISCADAMSCVAVGVATYSGATGTLAESWDGIKWTIDPTPAPNQDILDAFSGVLLGVSCTGPTACSAVGSSADLTGDRYAAAEHWDGSSWTTDSIPPPPGVTTPGSDLIGVSCADGTDCAAVGYTHLGGSGEALAERWDGSSWTTQPIPNPGASASQLNGVSCASASSCIAVGFDGEPVAESWDGNAWTTQSAASIGNSGSLVGVSCPTATACTAIGSFGDNSGAHTLAERWNGAGWSIQSTPAPAGPAENAFTGVSCADVTTCIAVGNTDEGPLAEEYAGPEPPANISPPMVSGQAVAGQTLTETQGDWTNAPSGYAYQWQDCDTTGSSCAAITGATDQNYTLSAADVGHTIRVQETASNDGGSSTPATSAATAPVSPPPALQTQIPLAAPTKPSNVSLPVISGAASVGDSLAASAGAWSGTPSISYDYQWQSCTPGCSNIANAGSGSYTVAAADRGARLQVVVTATNSAGSTEATSTEIGPVGAAGPTTRQVTAALSRILVPRGPAARIERLLKRGGYEVTFAGPSAGRLVIDWYLMPTGRPLATAQRKADPAPVLVGDAKAVLRRPGNLKVEIKLTAAGRKRLNGAQHVTLTARATFAATGERQITSTQTFTLRNS